MGVDVYDSPTSGEEMGVPEELQRKLFGNMIPALMGSGGTATATNRMEDDMSGKGGGPATAAPAPSAYGQQMKQRLADLIGQQQAANAPKPPMSNRAKLSQIGIELGGGLGAAFSGIPGSTQGAAKGIEEGIARRTHETDLENERRFTNQQRLAQQVQQQSELVGREETEQQRMVGAENLRRITEEGLNERLAKTIGSREKIVGEQNEEKTLLQEMKNAEQDRTNQSRVQVQLDRNKGNATVAQIRASAAANKARALPPVLTKSMDAFEDSQSRYDLMQKSYQAAMADPGNQQAMLLLLSNHLGMTMGLQHGARITQAIVSEAQRSGYLDERIEAHFGPDGFMTGVVLTPRQMNQMMGLAGDRLSADSRKVQELGDWFGVQGQTPVQPRFTPPPAPNGAPQQQGPPTPKPGNKIQQRKKPDGTIEYREVPIAR